MKRSTPVVLAAFGALGLFVHGGAMGLDYDEAVDGDLSTDQFNPTVIDLDLGANVISGTTTHDNGVTPLDRDFFAFVIAPGQTLESLILNEIITEPAFNVAFMAVDDQVGFDTLINPSNYLGFDTIGLENLNGDLLDELTSPEGPVESLGPGTYTFWYQETGSPTSYTFTANLVPEPGSAALLLGVVGLVARRRR